ncbi:MAG: ABC transporter permease [Bacilli bacterium]
MFTLIQYVLKRIGILLLTLLILVTVLFFLLQLLPGSPFNNPKFSETQILALENKYGLNEPLFMQYLQYLKNFVTGDLGESFQRLGTPVTKILITPLKYTSELVVYTTIVGVVIGLFLGSLAAIYKDKFVDTIATIVAILGVSLPSFVIATIIVLFLMWTQSEFGSALFPITLNVNTDNYFERLHSYIAPVIALSFFFIASLLRYMRSELVDVLESDYILLARSKGLNNKEIILRHGFRNALIPVVTVIGPLMVSLLGGSTFVERFFGVPGLANALINSINTLDYFVIMGIALFYSVLYMVVMLVIDVSYGLIDPRIRLAGGSHGKK